MLVPKPVLTLAMNRGVCVRFYHTVYHTETRAQIALGARKRTGSHHTSDEWEAQSGRVRRLEPS